jgi:AcrR family transcriptional regulator
MLKRLIRGIPMLEPTRSARRQALHDHKRQAILGAARQVLAERGLDGVTMREIAAAAGYVPGAIYAYFPTQQAILGELLLQSLRELGRLVKAAGGNDPKERVAHIAHAVHDFCATNPREIDLLLHLLQSARRTAISAELDRQINGRLIALLQPIAAAMQMDGATTRVEAERKTVALIAQITGVVLLQASGRLAVLGQDGAALVDEVARAVLER